MELVADLLVGSFPATQILALEQELGESLFHRRPRGVEATAAGELLLSHARILLAQAARLGEEFQGRREMERGKVNFGVIPTIAPYLLPQLVGPFRRTHPGIMISIHEARTEQLIAKVVSGQIEFAILSDLPRAERKRESLSLRPLFREPLLLAAPANHPLALRKDPPRPEDIHSAEFIHLSDGHCLAEQTLKVCKIDEPDPGLQCDQIATALAMVSAGLGVTIVPKLASRNLGLADIVCRAFAGNGLHRAIHLMKRSNSKLTPAAAQLMQVLLEPAIKSEVGG